LDFDALPEDLSYYEKGGKAKGKEENGAGEDLINFGDAHSPTSPPPAAAAAAPLLTPVPASTPTPSLLAPTPAHQAAGVVDTNNGNDEAELGEADKQREKERKREMLIERLTAELDIFKKTLEIKDEEALKLKRDAEVKAEEVQSLYKIMQDWQAEREREDSQRAAAQASIAAAPPPAAAAPAESEAEWKRKLEKKDKELEAVWQENVKMRQGWDDEKAALQQRIAAAEGAQAEAVARLAAVEAELAAERERCKEMEQRLRDAEAAAIASVNAEAAQQDLQRGHEAVVQDKEREIERLRAEIEQHQRSVDEKDAQIERARVEADERVAQAVEEARAQAEAALRQGQGEREKALADEWAEKERQLRDELADRERELQELREAGEAERGRTAQEASERAVAEERERWERELQQKEDEWRARDEERTRDLEWARKAKDHIEEQTKVCMVCGVRDMRWIDDGVCRVCRVWSTGDGRADAEAAGGDFDAHGAEGAGAQRSDFGAGAA
jgi:hypothetical protein